MTGIPETLAEARRHLHRVLEQIESIRWQLVGIKLSLPESSAEQVKLEDLGDETDPVIELRSTIDCVLEDDIRPALQDLQDALASTGGKGEEP